MRDNKASATAYTVVAGIQLACLDQRLASLVGAEALADQKRLLAASEEGRRRLADLGRAGKRGLARALEWLLMPGITHHYVLRKQYVRKTTEAALADGVTQVVVLGGGFDVMALGMHRAFPDVHFFEIDHPATSVVKQAALSEQVGETLVLISADLAKHSLSTVLGADPRFDRSRPTLFLCEGVFMYLDASTVEKTLNDIVDVAPVSARLVFSAVPPMGSPDINTGFLLKAYLRFLGEPLAWALRQRDVAPFLALNNWRVLDQADTSEMQRRYLPLMPEAGRHKGEYMVLAAADRDHGG